MTKQGPKPVESAKGALEAFKQPGVPACMPPIAAASEESGPHRDVLSALGHDPVSLDALLERTGRSTQELGAVLLELELAGRVARLPGQLFQRVGFG